ncbi:MAG: HU family DNA-binding protein [Clostridia bacterium]|nr:HU family DNA-binding protein [Clostridia bacterium]
MNKVELVEKVASKAEITKVEASKVVNAALESITEGLAADGKVVLIGFGTFEVRTRSAREGRNPRTGEKIKIAATKVPAFKPGKDMKAAVAAKKGKKK